MLFCWLSDKPNRRTGALKKKHLDQITIHKVKKGTRFCDISIALFFFFFATSSLENKIKNRRKALYFSILLNRKNGERLGLIVIRWTSQGPKSQATSSKMGERTRNSEKYVGVNERRGLWRGVGKREGGEGGGGKRKRAR